MPGCPSLGVLVGKRKFESTSGWAPREGSRWPENTWHMGTVTEFKFWVECMLCAVILWDLNLMFAVVMRRLYIRLLGGEQAVQLATLLRAIWLWWIFIFFKRQNNLPTGFYLPHSHPVFLYPLLHLSWGIWRGQWFWDIVTKGGSLLDHSVTCAEWLAKKPGGDERSYPDIFSGCWHAQQGQEARFRKTYMD